MKEVKLTMLPILFACAIFSAFVVAQEVGIDDLMKEMETPAGTNVAVKEPAPAAAVETPAAVAAPVVVPAVVTETPEVAEKPAVVIDDLIAPAVKTPEVAAPVVEAPEAEVAPVVEAVPAVAPAGATAVVPGTVAVPGEERDQLAKALSQQEEVRRQARELEGRKSMESADKAWKDDDFERALAHYRNALSKLPMTAGAAPMRSRAIARIPECEYQVVLGLVRAGKNDMALNRGREMLAQNANNRALQKLVTRIENDTKADATAAEKPKKTGEQMDSEIRKQMMIGKKAMADRDYELARSSFESVMAVDPQNRQAIGYLKELGDREYISNSKERQATAAKMSAQVRNTWNPQYKVIKAKTEPVKADQGAKKEPLLNKMDKIIIESIEFRQANIHDVVSFLNKASIDGDKTTEDQSRRGVNIILNLNPAGTAAATAKPAGGADNLFGETAPAGGAAGGQAYEITFQARYISLLQTLKIITSVAGLKFRVDGDIVMIVPADYDPAQIEIKMYPVEPTFIEKVKEVSSQMPTANDSVGGREVSRIGNNELNTGLPDLKTYFTQMGVRFPPGSSITYNSAIGKVIVGNTAENLATFERLLSELNVVPKQVEIETRFVEVNETDLMEAGLEWLLTDPFEIASKKGAAMLGGTERIQMNANAANGGMTRGLRFWGAGGDGADTPAMQGTKGAIASISSVLTNPELTMILHLLQQNGNADLLSAPKVTTRSGAEASIRVVTEYIYPTSFEVNGGQIGNNTTGAGGNNANIVQETTVTPQDFATREVGVLLTVLPEVSPDGNMINLTMQPQVVTEPTWYQYGSTVRRADGSEMALNMPQPFFHVRSLNTSISIYDGATVVMGGLITEDLRKINDKIPILGDIPLLGTLFRSKSERSIKKNLLIFVTAKLVDPAGRLIRQPEGDASQPAVVPGAMAPVAQH
jgi:general secretion pathway protein D